jgi:hypothetical protein
LLHAARPDDHSSSSWRRRTGSVKLAKVGSGDARIGTDEISQRLE